MYHLAQLQGPSGGDEGFSPLDQHRSLVTWYASSQKHISTGFCTLNSLISLLFFLSPHPFSFCIISLNMCVCWSEPLFHLVNHLERLGGEEVKNAVHMKSFMSLNGTYFWVTALSPLPKSLGMKKKRLANDKLKTRSAQTGQIGWVWMPATLGLNKTQTTINQNVLHNSGSKWPVEC